jgi:hypothetical protein
MNTVKAAFQALKKQRLPGKINFARRDFGTSNMVSYTDRTCCCEEEIARARGLKMVDVRKVYYGGLV